MLISQEILDIIRSTSGDILNDRSRLFLRLRHYRLDLFESLTSDVVVEFVERLIARCEAYIAFGEVLGDARSSDAVDEAIARALLLHLADRQNRRPAMIEAWQIALGFFFLQAEPGAMPRRPARQRS